MTETIGTMKAIPGIITLSPVIRNKFGQDATKVEKIIQKFSHYIRALFEKQKVCYIKF